MSFRGWAGHDLSIDVRPARLHQLESHVDGLLGRALGPAFRFVDSYAGLGLGWRMSGMKIRSAFGIAGLALVIAAGVVTPFPASRAAPRPLARAPTRPARQRIAFSCTRNRNTDIYERSADGGIVRRLTTDKHMDGEPSWSPSRRALAFVSYRRDGNPDIWKMRANGSSVRDLTPRHGSQTNPSWSPDGTQIVYASAGVSRGGLWIMDANGANKHFVPHAAGGFDPSWSPDGRRIVFVTAASGFDLFTIAPDGSSRRQITDNPSLTEDSAPVWSPRGSWIAFTQISGTRMKATRSLATRSLDLYIIRPSGSHSRKVLDDRAYDSSPDWSPNANRLVYEQDGKRDGLKILRLDTGRSHWFLRSPCYSPNWS